MHEFVGRQSALPLKGSYLAAGKMIYLLILWLVQEIKKSRRAGSEEQTYPFSPGILHSKDQGRDFPPGKQKSMVQARCIRRSCLVIEEGQQHTSSETKVPHISFCKPTCVSQDVLEHRWSYPWLLSQVQFQKGRFASPTRMRWQGLPGTYLPK